MWLRIKVRQQSGERDSEFTTTYDGVKYTVGPEPAEFTEEVGKYLIGSFSDFMEIVPEPGPVVEVLPPVTLKAKVKKPRRAGSRIKKRN